MKIHFWVVNEDSLFRRLQAIPFILVCFGSYVDIFPKYFFLFMFDFRTASFADAEKLSTVANLKWHVVYKCN